MLTVYYGSDEVAVRSAAQEFIQKQQKKGLSPERIDVDTYVDGVVRDVVQGVSLFGGERLIVCDTPSATGDMQAEVFTELQAIHDSQHIFLIIDGALKAPEKKKYEKVGATLEEYTAPKTERFNTFAMADALLQKDKKQLWLKLQEAREAGVSAEEIIGTFFWQIKMVRLAMKASSASEVGMKPFVYNKAKGALRTYTNTEIDQLSRDLLSIYHDGHGGVRNIDDALEAWLLKL